MIQHATTATHGPFRRVVGDRARMILWQGQPDIVIEEALECGHTGRVLRAPSGLDLSPGTRRRCMECRGATR